MQHVNAAFYCFSPISNLAELKQILKRDLLDLGLKGTVILAPEGMNGFLAGPAQAIRSALSHLRSLPPFTALHSKESESEEVPFGKLCIKLKKEIVTFRQPGTSPLETQSPAPRLAPHELLKWFEEGRDMILIDTRNEYETKIGTFEGAFVPPISHFVQFADIAKNFPEEWKKKTVVTFCTGGIRCEKAAPFMASLGYENVYQLEDGILGYMEKTGGKFWRGECFVFDQRIALGPDLKPTGARLCGHCQGPVPKRETNCIHCGQIT